MTKVVAFSLVFAILLQTFNGVGIRVAFWMNRNFIAKNLCENHSRPQLNCNGKCYLAKKLKAAEAQEKKNTPSPKSEKAEFLCQVINAFTFFPGLKPSGNALAAYPSPVCSSPIPDVFHPPQA